MIKNIIVLVVFVAVIVFGYKIRKKGVIGQPSEEPLTKNEKGWTWLLCIFNPIWAGAILYFWWKKTLPIKAKEANSISWKAFLFGIIFYGVLTALGI